MLKKNNGEIISYEKLTKINNYDGKYIKDYHGAVINKYVTKNIQDITSHLLSFIDRDK